jgi:hypothetical protein
MAQMQMAKQPKISDLDVFAEFPKDARTSLLDHRLKT